jgi:4-oxalocrotonate tautomerase
MPFIQITLAAGRTPEQKHELLASVSAAAAAAVSVPESSVRVWLVEVPATELFAGGMTLAERQAERLAGTS